MPSISLAFDTSVLQVPLPDSVDVRTLVPRPMNAIENPEEALQAVLESPIGLPSLSESVADLTGNVLIIVNDHTRVSGKERTLPWLLNALNRYGIPDGRIVILVALGTHKIPPEEITNKAIGPAFDRVKVVLHDTSGPMAECGTTTRGTPVLVNALLKEAGFVILHTAAIYHYFAGFGGGRKVIVPGIASLDTIKANHSLTWSVTSGEGGRHPDVQSGGLDGNPVHEDMLESARLALGDQSYISFVTVMTPDGGFGHFSAGELDASHRRACEFVEHHNAVDIDRRADLVLASAGGYPKDLNVIQSHKAMDNAARALKPGGTMLFAMGCAEGAGNPAVEEFASLDLAAIRRHLTEDYIINGQTVYAIKEKTEKFRVVCLSKLDPALVTDLGMHPAASLKEALRLIQGDITLSGLIYHLPRADMTLPTAVRTDMY